MEFNFYREPFLPFTYRTLLDEGTWCFILINDTNHDKE